MITNLLFNNPLIFVVWACAILAAIAIHEFFHAWTAYYLGDPTAKSEGRLTLNPFAHLDLMGTIFLLFVGFGWGKSVPFNPYNLRNQKYGPALVAISGPLSNLGLAIVSGLFLRTAVAFTDLPLNNLGLQFLSAVIYISLILMVFNLIPIPPLDGSKLLFVLMPYSWQRARIFLERYGSLLLIALLFLIVFGAIPLFSIVIFFYGLIAGQGGVEVLALFFNMF